MRIALAAFALAVATSPARADDASASEADRLFDEAAELMAQERWDEACPRFQRSLELEPARGTLLGVAQCQEMRGAVASAHAAYASLLDDAAAAGDDRRAAIARAMLEALEPRIPRLAIHLEAGVDPLSIEIWLDGELLDPGALGAALPVDPGRVTLAASAEGATPWTHELELAEGETRALVIPRLEVQAAPPEPALAPPAGPPRAPPTRYAQSENLAQRWVGYSALSGGALSVAAGGGFSVRAIRKHRRLGELCPAPCDAPGDDAARVRDQRDGAATVATGLIGVGLVAITGGMVLWSTSPRASRRPAERRIMHIAPLLDTTALGATLRARF
jgi:hypothetical protein